MVVTTMEPEGIDTRPAVGGEPAMRLARPVLAGLRDVVPVLLATLPLALAVGMTVSESTVEGWVGWLAAPVVFAGSAHLALVSMLDSGTAPVLAVAAALVINARFAVYGATLAPLFERQPAWFRYVAPQFIVDQSFALLVARPERHDPAWMRRYFLAAAGALAVMWLSGVGAGVVLGPVMPEDWPVSVAGPLMVASLLGTSLGSMRAVAVAFTAFVVAIALMPLVGAAAVILAAAVAVVAGRQAVRPARQPSARARREG